MLVVPIGTKSSLALKPKLTITLIAANIVVALITMPLMLRTESNLLKVQRGRFSRQFRLYLQERPRDASLTGVSQSGIDESAREIEGAKDRQGLQIALFKAFSLTGIDPGRFQNYEKTLRERDDAYYLGTGRTGIEHFTEWKELSRKENRIAEGNVLSRFGLIPGKMNRVHTFFTHIFLHGGIGHLLGNMLFLWVVGCLLEDSWGRIPFLLFYLAGGVIAGSAHCLQNTSSGLPLVGASGAIAAAMGAFTIKHFWTRIKFFYFFMLFFKPCAGTFCLPAFVFLPFWFIEQIGLHYLTGYLGGGSNVAYMAHIGGFSAGVVAALAMRFTGFEERFLAPSVQKTQVRAGVMKDPRFDRACDLLERGNSASARALFAKLLADRPEDIELIRDVAMLYREKGMAEDYAVLIEKALKLMILKGSMEEASQIALEIISGRDGVPISAQYLMRVAKHLVERESFGEAHDVYRSIIASNPAPNVSLKARIALAKLLRDKMNNANDAFALLEEARKLPHDAEWEETISELEASLAHRENTLYA